MNTMKVLALLACSLYACGAVAQNASESKNAPTLSSAGKQASASPPPLASGKVVGPGNQPAVGVPVQVEGPQGKGVIFTNSKGEWTLYNLPAGTYQVKPFPGTEASTSKPVEFSVKQQGLLDKLLGAAQSAYVASEIKLKENFKK